MSFKTYETLNVFFFDYLSLERLRLSENLNEEIMFMRGNDIVDLDIEKRYLISDVALSNHTIFIYVGSPYFNNPSQNDIDNAQLDSFGNPLGS